VLRRRRKMNVARAGGEGAAERKRERWESARRRGRRVEEGKRGRRVGDIRMVEKAQESQAKDCSSVRETRRGIGRVSLTGPMGLAPVRASASGGVRNWRKGRHRGADRAGGAGRSRRSGTEQEKQENK
jgi:hypothetical protein